MIKSIFSKVNSGFDSLDRRLREMNPYRRVALCILAFASLPMLACNDTTQGNGNNSSVEYYDCKIANKDDTWSGLFPDYPTIAVRNVTITPNSDGSQAITSGDYGTPRNILEQGGIMYTTNLPGGATKTQEGCRVR